MGIPETVTAKEAEVAKVTRGKLVEDLKAVVADAEELLKATASQTGERIAAARAKAEESRKAVKARLAEQESAMMAKTKAVAKAADGLVRANRGITDGDKLNAVPPEELGRWLDADTAV